MTRETYLELLRREVRRNVLYKQVVELALGQCRTARNDASFSRVLEESDFEFEIIKHLAIHLSVLQVEFAYLLTSLGCFVSISKLDVPKAARRVILVN